MLTPAQLSFFARNGYLVLPGLVAAADCAELVEETWRLLPGHWRRDQPWGWAGAVADSCHAAPVEARAGHLKFQKRSYGSLHAAERAFGAAGACAGVAAEMLGTLAPPRERGLYVVAPTRGGWLPRAAAHHIESHPVQAVALGYLEDVPAGAGALLVWPGSHRALYPLMRSRLEHAASPAYEAVYRAWTRLRPVELPGRRGDVVYIHHRLLHAPSRNTSARMRFAFLCDYMREDFEDLCTQAPGPDPWEDWPGLAGVDPAVRAAGADEKLARTWHVPSFSKAPDERGFINKRAASALARQRQPGDVWLVITDSRPGTFSVKLDPTGGDLAGRGLRVSMGGIALHSLSENGFAARLGTDREEFHLTVQAPCPIWLKLVAVRLPFAQSRLVHAVGLRPGTHHVAVDAEVESAHAPCKRGDEASTARP